MDGTARHAHLLSTLGPHTLTGYCVYFKRLSDVELPVLEQLIRESCEYVTVTAKAGPILWKADE